MTIKYYRDTDMREIDLLVERDGQLHLVEIKKAALIDKRIASVFKLIEKSGLQQGLGAVICLSDTFGAIDRQTLTIPIGSI